MTTLDYFAGFEGESELTVSRRNVKGIVCSRLKMWIGYFDEIVSLINPNDHGKWEGVLLEYHQHTGWYEQKLWKCRDVPLFIDQLLSIDNQKLTPRAKSVWEELIELLKVSVENKEEIWFKYF